MKIEYLSESDLKDLDGLSDKQLFLSIEIVKNRAFITTSRYKKDYKNFIQDADIADLRMNPLERMTHNNYTVFPKRGEIFSALDQKEKERSGMTENQHELLNNYFKNKPDPKTARKENTGLTEEQSKKLDFYFIDRDFQGEFYKYKKVLNCIKANLKLHMISIDQLSRSLCIHYDRVVEILDGFGYCPYYHELLKLNKYYKKSC